MKTRILLVLAVSLSLTLNPAAVPEAQAWLVPLAKAIFLGSTSGKKKPGKLLKGIAAASTATTAVSLMGLMTDSYAAPPDPETLTEVEKEMREAIEKGESISEGFICKNTLYEKVTGEYPLVNISHKKFAKCILPDGSFTAPILIDLIYSARVCSNDNQPPYQVPSGKRCPGGLIPGSGKKIAANGKIVSRPGDHDNNPSIVRAYHKSAVSDFDFIDLY